MFTGIIEDLGKIISATQTGLRIASHLSGITTGESIAVNGVCLTVSAFEECSGNALLNFDYSPETAERTTIPRLLKGSPVNLERALSLGDRLGGHFVTGHVESVGELRNVRRDSDSFMITFSLPEGFDRFIVPKGSITVDGISLTVAASDPSTFTAAVIPHTLRSTTLHLLRPGDAVNLEPDLLLKYVEQLLNNRRARRPLNADFLNENGFF